MRQSELTAPRKTDPDSTPKRITLGWLNLSLLDGLLLAVALLAAYLPIGWTRDLKRIKQAPLYSWLSLGYFVVYAVAVWWAFRSVKAVNEGKSAIEQRYHHKWLALAGLVVIPNLFNIWLRATSTLPDGSLLFGQDLDTILFFKYGSDFAHGLNPTNPLGQYMEYPQFALLLFWVGYLLGDTQQNFNFAFPSFLTIFQLIAAFALYGSGRKLGQARAGFLVAAFVAGCPALFGFSYTRFDVAPVALLLAAVYFYLPSKNGSTTRNTIASGLITMAGGLTKWLPVIIAPWLVAGYVQARRWRQLMLFGAVSLGLALVTVVPFYLWNAEAFWYPYKFQGSRKMIGESFWFLIQQAFLDPEHGNPEKPWGEPAKILLGNNKLLAAQLALTLLVLALSFWRLWWVRRKIAAVDFAGWAASGLIGVAVFTLANRVFSPQYLILLAWVWAAACVLRPVGRFGLIAFFALISIATAANFQVYLLGVYPEEWIRDSWLMFGASWILCGGLLFRSFKPQMHTDRF